MKKHYLFLTAAAALLSVGCTTSDEVATTPSQAQSDAPTAVQFGTYMGRQGVTRAGTAGAITTESLQTGTHATSGFGVFAYMKGTDGLTDCYTSSNWNDSKPNFMYNQQVKYESPAWTYTPVKYWPNDFAASGNVDNKTPGDEDYNAQGSVAAGKVSFFAYAPYVEVTPSTGNPTTTESGITALSSNTAETEPTVTYKLASSANVTSNVDLLWGIRKQGVTYGKADGTTDSQASSADIYNTDLTKQTTDEKIKFYFKHALAKIGGLNGLKVQLDVDDNTGTKTLDAKSNVSIQSITINGVEDKIATTGTFNIAKGTWAASLDTDYSPQTLFNINHETTGVDADIFTAVGTPFTYDTSWNHEGVTNTAKSVFTSGTHDEFYLIPGVADQEIEVTITYQVRTYDTNLNGNYSTVNQTIKNIVKLPALESNKYYTLIMHLGLTSVKFEATVADWESTGSGIEKNIWLPSNVVPAP